MAVEVLSEKIYSAKKIGRVELQASSLEDIFEALFRACYQKLLNDYQPSVRENLVYSGHRYERVSDGAGVWHYNLYAYYDPIDGPLPLPPRNLNNAEQNVLGQTLSGDQLMDIGTKERKF